MLVNLWRHETWCACVFLSFRHVFQTTLVDSQAEVDDLDPLVGMLRNHHILGLKVAMNDAQLSIQVRDCFDKLP